MVIDYRERIPNNVDFAGNATLQRCLNFWFSSSLELFADEVSTMNEVTRQAYIKDCDHGVQRWSRMIEDAGLDFRLCLPERGVNRLPAGYEYVRLA